MRWLGRWFDRQFDETDWPKDPLLDPFRDAVWQLSLDGEVKGWVTTSVTPMRSLPFFWSKLECMWNQVHWVDEKHEDVDEDYGPDWIDVEELLTGHFTVADSRFDREGTFDAIVLTGPEGDRLWDHLSHGAVLPSHIEPEGL